MRSTNEARIRKFWKEYSLFGFKNGMKFDIIQRQRHQQHNHDPYKQYETYKKL